MLGVCIYSGLSPTNIYILLIRHYLHRPLESHRPLELELEVLEIRVNMTKLFVSLALHCSFPYEYLVCSVILSVVKLRNRLGVLGVRVEQGHIICTSGFSL